MTTVAILSSDAGRRYRLAALLGAAGHAVCEPGDAEAAVVALASTGRDGIAEVRAARAALPVVAIVAIATPSRDHDIRLLVAAGAQGVVLDAEAERTLEPVLRAVLAGHVCIPRGAGRQAVRPACSHREKQILALLAEGATNRQIGDALFLSESTVKSHLASAFAKLGVRSRAEAAAVLEEQGVLDPTATGAVAA